MDGSMKLITRLPDLRQALYTSVLEEKDIVIRSDDAGASEVYLVPEVLEEYGIDSPAKRVGYEADSCTLTHRVGKLLEAAVADLCTLVDHSFLFSQELRVIKSEAELRKIRKAAYLADFSHVRAVKQAKPGAYEGDVWRELVGTVHEGGGDDPAMPNVLVSGNKAVLTRYSTGRTKIDRQLTLEHAAVYKRYHCCLMRVMHVGGVTQLARRMFEVNKAQMAAALEVLRPGREIGDVFEAYARVGDEAGFRDGRLDACGYSLGATFAPSWMDHPLLCRGQDIIARPGMVFFIHMILLDKATDTATAFGQTVEVTETGCVALSKLPPSMTRKRTLAAWKKVRKADYGFTAEEEDDGENLRDIELSEGDADADDYEVEYDFSNYQPAANPNASA
jgi:Xaa-Pro dipeptidase